LKDGLVRNIITLNNVETTGRRLSTVCGYLDLHYLPYHTVPDQHGWFHNSEGNKALFWSLFWAAVTSNSTDSQKGNVIMPFALS